MSMLYSSFESNTHQLVLESVDHQPLSSQERFLASLVLPGNAVLGEVDPTEPIRVQVGEDVTPHTIATLGLMKAASSVSR